MLDETGGEEFAPLGAHILLVEDNPMNQMVIGELLDFFGCSFDLAENGNEAVEKVKAAEYRLVLMDCQLPLCSGYDACKMIRQLPEKSEVVVLALTANAMPEDQKRCIDSGMNGVITKPVRAADLYVTLAQYL